MSFDPFHNPRDMAILLNTLNNAQTADATRRQANLSAEQLRLMQEQAKKMEQERLKLERERKNNEEREVKEACKCLQCNGTGKITKLCDRCKGNGQIFPRSSHIPATEENRQRYRNEPISTCDRCNGNGIDRYGFTETCPHCRGKGEDERRKREYFARLRG